MVTHKMLEILASVARMPQEYRRLRKTELIKDYQIPLSQCSYANEAFEALIGDKQPSELSEQGRACFLTVNRMAARDLQAVH